MLGNEVRCDLEHYSLAKKATLENHGIITVKDGITLISVHYQKILSRCQFT